MTTITITKSKAGDYLKFICKGHAGYGDSGSDIVCSAVSILVINTVNSLELLTDTKFKAKEKEAQGVIECSFTEPPDKGGKLLLDAMVLGLQNVAKEYGGRYLKLKFKEV
ncbi:MAG: ribosomal-processing cysteine protease Prp [Clostridium sp.]|nr:ribosomal-processing cysteine protease Prp [Clostridium sp.]